MEIKQVRQTIEKLGILISIIHPSGIKTEIADALSRLSSAEDCELKEKFFQQTYHHMNLILTKDLFSQYFNILLPRFMSTIIGDSEITIDALNLVWIMEFPWIHPPTPLLPAVLKKI
ncbi:MAG: hypothetical protein EZS28_029693 [Streblomastix strix]|uniref:Uncharacterized protein n=1 Tax=Streblomastix strix TaxID=222440 RepID=A0A5J4UWE4_9EUKA|nr:MAG: hypothetical protein EZS28_029693 [Streblomastix strix]